MTARTTFTRGLDRIGIAATFVLPLGLTHLRGIAEICIDIVAVAFLVRSMLGRSWTWARAPWFVLSLAWWGWQCVCSLPVGVLGAGGWNAFLQGVMAVRFLVLAAALGCWTLANDRALKAMMGVIAACCVYVAAQIVLQAVTGHNLFGAPRFHDGTLTGPYRTPRAAAPLSRIVIPTLMLGCAIAAGRWRGMRAGLAMTGLAVVTAAVMVVAGQRMPLVLTMLGLAVCAAFYRPLRPVVVVAAVSLPVLVAAASLVSRGSFFHLVVLAQQQLTHFRTSPYGRIFLRAAVMAQANPLTGSGYDAFRHACADPAYFHGLSWLGSSPNSTGGGRAICVQHAHNHYLQAATNAGLPGLVLFCAMIAGWLVRLWPLSGRTSPRVQAFRIGIFAAIVVQEWPIASTSDFMNLPLGGWAFLLLGTGLSTRRAARETPVQYPGRTS